jgi:hypothetical protein
MVKVKRKTTMGIAVALAAEALRHPAVQQALRQAPGVVSKWRHNLAREGDSAGTAMKRKVTGRVGQARLERRAADLRSLVKDLASMPAAKRIDAATVHKVTDALDVIDLELRLASHQSLVDRKRHHYRISAQLDALVNALSAPMATDEPV